MINQRYKALVNSFDKYTYHILGCGAIGSAAASQIARMGGVNINLYDMDEVNTENIGVSMYSHRHLNMPKVEALQEILEDINPECDINIYNGLFEEHNTQGQDNNDIIVLGFDSMDSRKDAVEKIMKKRKPLLLIDGRMGAEHYQQYTFKNPTMKQYLATWYSDEEGSSEPCNAKATSYCSNMSGSFISNTIKKILRSEPYQQSFAFNFPTMALDYKSFTT
jgi:hypothetical protein